MKQRMAPSAFLSMFLNVFLRKEGVKYSITSTLLKRVAQLFSFLPITLGCAIFGGGTETHHRAKGYDVKIPESWVAVSTNRESDRTYKTSIGNIATLTSSCQRNADAPLEVLTRHLLLGARATTFTKKETIFVAGKEGQHSSVKTTLDGSPVFLEIFVLPKASCVFDFSLVSNREIPETERKDFISFFKSFKYGIN